MPQEAKRTEWSDINLFCGTRRQLKVQKRSSSLILVESRTDSFIREGLNVRGGLYVYGLPFCGCLVVGCFRTDYNLGTITTEFYVFTNPYISLFRRSIHLFLGQVFSGQQTKQGERCRLKDMSTTEAGLRRNSSMSSIYTCWQAGNILHGFQK